MKDRQKAAMSAPMLIWAALFVGAALLYIVGLSFMARDASYGVKNELTLDNYKKLADPTYLSSLWLSVRLAFFTSALCLLIGYPFGYLMARAPKKTRAWLMILVIAPFWTNALIRIYGWRILMAANGPINEFLLWLGVIQKPLKLLYTENAVLMGMVYAMLPFMILPTYTAVERMDWSVAEAARDLGASPIKAFFTVTLRLTLPGLMAGCVLTFLPSIGLFFISDLLGGSNTMLWGNIVHNELLKSRDLPFAAALSVVLLLLTGVVIYVYRRAGGSTQEMVF